MRISDWSSDVCSSDLDWLGHRAVCFARRRGLATLASLHTRFETYPRYYGLPLLEPIFVWMLKRFYGRVDQVMVPTPSVAELLEQWGVATPIGIWSRGINHDRFSTAEGRVGKEGVDTCRYRWST